MEKIRNLSLRKTIFLYMAAALILSFFLCVFIQYRVQKIQVGIWQKYVSYNEYIDKSRYGTDYLVMSALGRSLQDEIPPADSFKVEVCDFLYTWSPLVVPLTASAAVILLFYRNKLKKPLSILMEGARKISENDLDFTVD